MKKVALGIEINNNAGRGVLGGVLKFASGRSQWNIKLLTYPESMTPEIIRNAKSNGIDGFIVNHVGDESTAAELKSTSLPVSFVDIDHPLIRRRRRNTAFIGHRNDIVGALGARKFLSLGKFRSFAFVGHSDEPAWSMKRQSGYQAELKKFGITAEILTDDLARGLTSLPRPIAVMVAWDYKAIEVMESCHELGLHIPDEVSVIGVDDDPLVCGFTNPSLTSVAPSFERLGYCAAAALDAMMNGRKNRTQNCILCRPMGLTERASTRFLPPAVVLLHKAKEIIERDAIRGLTVQDLSIRLGVSQQLLALRFRQFEKRTVRDTILDTRLEHVKTRLTHQNASLASIAHECGFNSANRLAHLFKQRFGLSPGAFARKAASAT